jgi:hypothetical protein
MKISELFEAEGLDQIFASVQKQHKERTEGPKMPMAQIRTVGDPNYTPGKAALDKMYKDTDKFTKNPIPNKQKKICDPRN